jgi:hypothetical protein|tara:strand:- start:741 stop:1298 length:558 start_codon:yes stop_codon:yes gene_type:complete
MQEEKSIYDLKEEYIEAAIESDEVNNREMQKGDKLENLQYTDGKVRDEIDEIEAKEKIRGVDKISPFGTNNTKVFKRKLSNMTPSEKTKLAEKTATRIYADAELQDQSLTKAFHEWRGTNWGSTGGRTEEKVKALASDSLEDFEKKLKSKTLSELQEMAMKLGFTPSFDRIRLISALKQAYLKRG